VRTGLCLMMTVIIASDVASAAAQQAEEPVAAVFQRLESPSPADIHPTAEQLLNRGRSDPKVREYIAAHLPPLIEKGPAEKDRPGQWIELVRLAGGLKIAEAAPVLTMWLSIDNIGEITTAGFMRLENNPAGAALVQIGDPAIPAVARVFDRGTLRERRYAVYILNQINSPNARGALRERLSREPDKELREFIRRTLGG
jgi:hypothetical protein